MSRIIAFIIKFSNKCRARPVRLYNAFYFLFKSNKMFVIANFALKKGSFVKENNIQTYAIAVGVVFYAAIYMYLLFSKSEFLAVFNKFIIYIIGVDLILSALLFSNHSKKQGVVVNSLDDICANNGYKNDTTDEEGVFADDEEDNTSTNDSETASTNDDIDSANENEIANDLQATGQPQKEQNEVKEFFAEVGDNRGDDLETLVLNSDLVNELEQISSSVVAGPKKRGRKPKSALSQA